MEVPRAATMDDVNYILEEMQKFIESQFQSMADRHKKLEQRLAHLEEKLQGSNAKSTPNPLPSPIITSLPPQPKAPKPAFYSTLPRRTFMQTFVASTSVGENYSNSNGTVYGSPESISRNSKPFHLQSAPPRRPALLSSALVNTVNTNENSNTFSRSKSMTNIAGGNSDGEMAVVDAAKEGDQEKLKALLESAANPNVVGAFGHTALHWAINNNFADCVRMLLEAGAKVEDRDYLGKTSLHRACVKGHAECVEELLYYEADVNVKDNTGNTPLHDAACYGHVDCVRALVRAKATRNEKNEAGETAQGLAVRHDHEECAQIIRCGAVDKRTV